MAKEPIEHLRDLAGQGVSPDAIDLLPAHGLLVDLLVEQHGSLARARSAARLSPRRALGNSKSVVVRRLRALKDRGVRLTAQRLRELGEEPLLIACYQLFGSLPAARSAAGVATPRRSDAVEVPGDWILDALRGRAGAVRVLAASDVDTQLAIAARRRFGSLRKAIEAAGLAVGRKGNDEAVGPGAGGRQLSPSRRTSRRRGAAAIPTAAVSLQVERLVENLVSAAMLTVYREAAATLRRRTPPVTRRRGASRTKPDRFG